MPGRRGQFLDENHSRYDIYGQGNTVLFSQIGDDMLELVTDSIGRSHGKNYILRDKVGIVTDNIGEKAAILQTEKFMTGRKPLFLKKYFPTSPVCLDLILTVI